MSPQNKEERFIERYREIKGKLEFWGKCVEDRLSNTFSSFKPIVSLRLKAEDSLYGKAYYRNLYDHIAANENDETIDKLLAEIKDKIGVRIVVKDPATAQSVFDSIKCDTHWKSDVTREIKDTIYAQPDTFIYTGYHVIVSPTGAGPYPLWSKQFITCEVQIRTKLQDAYADVSHDIVYKKVFRHDIEIRRLLARSMALLEVVDESFKSVYDMTSNTSRYLPAYVDHLVDLYKMYSPSFREGQIDYRVFDQCLNLLEIVSSEKLDPFLAKRERTIKAGLRVNNGSFLFKQPIILLLAYYATLQPDYLEASGFLSSEDLRRVSEGFNIATTTY